MSTAARKRPPTRTAPTPEPPPTIEFPEVMTCAQAAAFLTVSEPWLRLETRIGEVPHSRLGRRVVYEKSELLAWVRKQQTPKRQGPR
jgi:hypothetical protein